MYRLIKNNIAQVNPEVLYFLFGALLLMIAVIAMGIAVVSSEYNISLPGWLTYP